MTSENEDVGALILKPYTVSAVMDDGLESVIKHCIVADAQAARDQVIMDTGGRVIIASVFEGHLSEPDAIVFQADRTTERDNQEEADSLCM